ncbi:MAG: MTH938/NDUFAF3 family protein [Parcubacteria group bacterium]
MIEEYKFGTITIDGINYDTDVQVDWNGEVSDWSRPQDHLIGAEDVKRAVDKNPETIVIGTGEGGMAIVVEGAKIFIQEKGIKLLVDKTEEAVKTFNILKEDSPVEEGRQERVVGLFHLTC